MERKSQAELREKANRLPLSPGVYLMYGADDKVIYVGKSKALKNRVSQYFTDSEKNIKTSKMVSSVYDFDYMLTDTEIEALVLENKLIKLYQPKYNILLKDAKSYPYLKVTVGEEYPRVLVTRSRIADGARYFGPYSGSYAAWNILHTVQKTFGLPTCKCSFPKDIGRVRPCLYSQIGQCCAPCTGKLSAEDYRERFPEILTFLRGSYSEVQKSLREKMIYASENLQFEAAALYRDRLKSLEALWQKQRVVGSPDAEYDIISLYLGDTCSCLAIYYVRGGAVVDSDNFIFTAERIVDGSAVISFLCELYGRREYIPRTVLVGWDPGDDQLAVFEQYLGRLAAEKELPKIGVRIPQKGDLKQLCDMVYENAALHARQYLADAEKDDETLLKLASMLSLEVVPENIESIDISNYGNENITAGIISVVNGKFNKKGYRSYKIRSTSEQDDYLSMREALTRRISHTEEQPLPDLFLLDGGRGHVNTIRELFAELGVDVPVFGMVKDDFHKTRAITDGTNEISIAREQSVFVFVYKIQEEVHRYTIGRMRKSKEKTMKRSSLEDISGIGSKKASSLLAAFGTLSKLRGAGVSEIAAVKGISERDAEAVYRHFHREEPSGNDQPG